MLAMRVDMIVVACILIDFVIDQLNITRIDFVPFSMKTSLFLSDIEEFQLLEKQKNIKLSKLCP